MNKIKKILIRGGIALGAVIAFLAILVLIVSRVWDVDSIARNAAANLESHYHLHTRDAKLSFLPSPRVSFYGVVLSAADSMNVSADSVVVYPNLSHLLFSGKFTPAKIEVAVPRVRMKLPQPTAAANPAQQETPEKNLPSQLARYREKLAQLHALAFATMPDVAVSIDDGILEFYSGQERAFWFHEVDVRASVHANRLDVELTGGKSDLWDAVTFNGWVYPREWKSSGELNLTRGAPKDLLGLYLPGSAGRLSTSELDLTLSFSCDGPSNAKADFSASIPEITLQDGDDKVTIQNSSASGTLFVDNTRFECSIGSLRFDYPRVAFNGKFVKNYADQTVSLTVEGRDMDVAAVRKATLIAVGQNRPMQRTFGIVRGGDIPYVIFESRAKKASDLGELDNFTLRARLENGLIFPPKAELLVMNVKADARVVNGILEGDNIFGNSAGTYTRNGNLRIGLRKEDGTFHLDLPVDADLSELPPILNRLVKNDVFKQELAQMKQVQGRAIGRMILGEDLDNVNVHVQTEAFRLSAQYDRFADPVELDGASFSLNGPKLAVGKVNGKTGKSRLNQFDLSFDWTTGKNLDFSSQTASIVSFDLINPLIERQENWKKALSGDVPIKGLLHLASISFKGNLSENAKWVFKAEGEADDVAFNTKFFSGSMHLKSGGFEVTRDTLRLKQLSTALSESSLLVSGSVNGWFDNLRSADLTLSGHLGPEGNKNIAAITGIPAAFRAIPNLNLGQSRLVWEKEAKTAFNGQMQLSSGPHITLNLTHTPKELSVEELSIRDEDSDATISFTHGDRKFQVEFSGALSNKTADRLLTENKFLTGPMEGKFSAVVDLDNPRKSTAQGQLRISGFQLPANLRVPALIEDATLDADGNRINVRSSRISWDGSSLSLGGIITVDENAYIVDMNAAAETLNMESILNAKKEEQPGSADSGDKPAGENPKKAWDAPVRGRIQVKSDHLIYEKLTWSPASATVVFSPGTFDITVDHANLCGIATPGTASITPGSVKMAMNLEARNADLEPAVVCFFDKQHLATGKFDLQGKISGGNGNGSRKFADTIQGELNFKARDGRIYRFESFAKIISLLSITEIYRGQLPDLFSEGCAFDTIQAKAKIKEGQLVLTDSVMDGPSVKMVFRGDVDLSQKKVDITALVTPIRTVDRILGVVPVFGKLLDGAFISVPVRIVGDLNDPEVIPMSPTAVGEELLGFMKRTFKLPFTLLQPLANGASKAAKSLESKEPAREAPQDEAPPR